MEPTTGVGLAAIAAAYLGKDGVNKLLGPTAEYFGEGLKDVVERRVQNLQSVLSRASRKLGAEIEKPGAVPPRVLKDVLSEGTFSDDPVSLEYFAGVVASARTPDGLDDRGLRYCKIIGRLSSFQLRGHYLLYSRLLECYSQSGLRLTKISDRKSMAVYVPLREFLVSMEIANSENAVDLLSHTLHGLLDDGLLDSWLMGSQDVLKRKFSEVPSKDGLVYKPSLAGAEVFNAALGRGSCGIDLLLSDEIPEFSFDLTTQKINARPIAP